MQEIRLIVPPYVFTQKPSFHTTKRNLGLASASVVTPPLRPLVGAILSRMFTPRCPMIQTSHCGHAGVVIASQPSPQGLSLVSLASAQVRVDSTPVQRGPRLQSLC